MSKVKFLIFSISIIVLISGCGIKYIPYKDTLIKKVKWDTREEYREYKKKHKNITLDGYNVELYKVEPYLVITYGHLKGIALRDEQSFREKYYLSYSKYFYDYTFLMYTLNKEPFNKKLKPYFKTINKSYENKLKQRNINKFVNYPCDKNIIYSKWERDEYYQPLKKNCYVKRLEKDVFLITRFGYPNTQSDTKLFQNEIIPTMLKGIKVTPTKLSPWKYY